LATIAIEKNNWSPLGDHLFAGERW